MKKQKTKKDLPTMLVLRGRREAPADFYKKCRRFKILYLAATAKKNYIQGNFHHIGVAYRPAFWFNPIQRKQRVYNNLSWIYVAGLEKFVRQADVVNLSDLYYFFNAEAVRIAKKHQKPVVTIVWTTIPCHITTWLPPYSWNARLVIEHTDLFILRCKTALRFTDSLGISRERVKVIYKGVDLNLFRPARHFREGQQVKIIFVGNLHADKGVVELLDVFELLIKRYGFLKLALAGSGPLRGLVKEKSKGLPIELMGYLDHQQLADFYRQGDIFCAPSKAHYTFGVKTWEEYFSYSLMEAQASGLPIVATRTGGIPEEVDGRNFLVESGDKDQLFWALERLIINSRLRRILAGINRRRAVERFDAKKQAEKTEQAILRTIRL